jgi:hypothetical protein
MKEAKTLPPSAYSGGIRAFKKTFSAFFRIRASEKSFRITEVTG